MFFVSLSMSRTCGLASDFNKPCKEYENLGSWYSRSLDSTYSLISDNANDTFNYQGDKACKKKSTVRTKQL